MLKEVVERKRVRVCVKSSHVTYEGYLTIPKMRNRISDVLNEPERLFISLTDVHVDRTTTLVPFVILNRNVIESVTEAPELAH